MKNRGGVTIAAHAEYELVSGRQTLARIVRGPEGWRVLLKSDTSSFGFPVSPVGMNRFRDVKAWAIEALVEQES